MDIRVTCRGSCVLLAVAFGAVTAGGGDRPARVNTPTVTAPMPRAAATPLRTPRLVLWLADGEGMHPAGDLEGFLVDRLGATGERMVVEPEAAHAFLRMLGLSQRRVFDPMAAQRLATAADADWVLWVKIVSRDLTAARGLSIPYLLNRHRLDAHLFFDVRVYDATAGHIIGSKRLRLSDKGEGTWQVLDDERFDPAYNNDPVEIHQRMRLLDWRAAAAISGYCADLLRLPRTAETAGVGRQKAVHGHSQNPAVAPVSTSGSGDR